MDHSYSCLHAGEPPLTAEISTQTDLLGTDIENMETRNIGLEEKMADRKEQQRKIFIETVTKDDRYIIVAARHGKYNQSTLLLSLLLHYYFLCCFTVKYKYEQ